MESDDGSDSPPPPVLIPEVKTKTKRIIKPPSRLNQYDISHDPFLYDDDEDEFGEDPSYNRRGGKKKRSKLVPPELIKQETDDYNEPKVFDNKSPPKEPGTPTKRAALPPGNRELVKEMANRGHALFIGTDLKWIGSKPADRSPLDPNTASYEVVKDMELKRSPIKDTSEKDLMHTMGTVILRSKKTSNTILVPRSFAIEPTPEMRMKKYQQRKMKENKLLHAKKMKKIVNAMKRKTKKATNVPANYASDASGTGSDSEYLTSDELDESDVIVRRLDDVWKVPAEVFERSPTPVVKIERETPKPKRNSTSHETPSFKKAKKVVRPKLSETGRPYDKPPFSYSCLVALALKNAPGYCLPVSAIYQFMCDHFPYFINAPGGWKNSVRHNLSLNKCFEKRDKPGGNGAKKGCLWALIVQRMHKMDDEIQKWLRKDIHGIRRTMSDPENLEQIERGEFRKDYSGLNMSDEEEDVEVPNAAVKVEKEETAMNAAGTVVEDESEKVKVETTNDNTVPTDAPSSPDPFTAPTDLDAGIADMVTSCKGLKTDDYNTIDETALSQDKIMVSLDGKEFVKYSLSVEPDDVDNSKVLDEMTAELQRRIAPD